MPTPHTIHGIWRVSMLNTGADLASTHTLLISHKTPFSAFLPLFGQAVRVDSLAHGIGAHLNQAFVGTVVPNHNTWRLFNELVVDDLAHKPGTPPAQPCILGRLVLVEYPVRGSNRSSRGPAPGLEIGSGDSGHYANLKGVEDPRYQQDTPGINVRYPYGVWNIDMPRTNPNVDLDAPVPTSLSSHTTSLSVILSHFAQAARIDSLTLGIGAHLREVFLGMLICDESTWAAFNKFMIDEFVPVDQRGRGRDALAPHQPWILGRLALMDYSGRDHGGDDGPPTDAGGGDEDEDLETVDPIHKPKPGPPHISQPLPILSSPTVSQGEHEKPPGIKEAKSDSALHVNHVDVDEALNVDTQRSVPERVSKPMPDETNDLVSAAAITRAQEHCRVAINTLGCALIDVEKARAAIWAVAVPPGEQRVFKWLLGFLVEFLFLSFVLFFVVCVIFVFCCARVLSCLEEVVWVSFSFVMKKVCPMLTVKFVKPGFAF